MKPSHLTTPRSLDECHFQTGYRCAEPRDGLAEAGHLLLSAIGAVGLCVAVVLVLAGVL